MTRIMTRKMKLKKNFVPVAPGDDDEYFANGIFEFNITKLVAFIRAKPDIFPTEQVTVAPLARFVPMHLDEKTIQQANLSNPIVLGEISPGRFNVIDGNHRLEKARRDGLETIPAYRVAAEHHVAFLKSVRAYQAYIGYWNGKLKEA
ncbi:ParB N-terminal domain-containing protein [Bdellovibrionota bacterium FG-2]